MTNLLIIGCGNVGSRHLQGAILANKKLNISIVEPNKISIIKAKRRISELKKVKLKKVLFYKSIKNIKENIDIVIVATNSINRKKIIEEIINRKKIKFLILEKVVCQSIYDFNQIIKKTKKHKVKTWVNCPYRTLTVFKSLKKNNKKSLLTMNVDGNFNLASNLIHYLDLFSYLSSDYKLKLNYENIDNKIYKSKRKGFVELSGNLSFNTSKGDILSIADCKKTMRPTVVNFSYKDSRLILFESENSAIIQNKKNNWKWKKIHNPISYQSFITKKLLESIIVSDECNLIKLEDSYKLHKSMFKIFQKNISLINNKKTNYCNIT